MRKVLVDQGANESNRLIAAELAGDSTVINDDLADTQDVRQSRAAGIVLVIDFFTASCQVLLQIPQFLRLRLTKQTG